MIAYSRYADQGKGMPKTGSNLISFVGWSLDRVSWEEESPRGPPFRGGKSKGAPGRQKDPEGAHSQGVSPSSRWNSLGQRRQKDSLGVITTGSLLSMASTCEVRFH